MKDFNIDEVLEKLYEIDEAGIVLEEKLDQVEDEYYKKLLENLKKSEREYMKAARVQAKRKTKEILAKTIEEEQAIMETCYSETDRLDDIMKNHKEELIKKVFEHVFLDEV
ncbi:hypothetical protein EZV73_17430 [Acidaminobacter sp. JC074]|uniref:hypothetical protein n=1 Tax=Acidaminobacter sp. JC074 TaxID=2530199 RepID=UPI001F0FA4B5|nr:hypothetical protein [Acidaminobacter sp. JC074]MCH4889384.1 hypothetical protein [Acidaminobacter sp. JC074]